METRDGIQKKSGIFTKILEATIYLIIVNASYIVAMYIDDSGKYTQRNVDAYLSVAIYITIASLFVMIFYKMFKTFSLTKRENIFIVFCVTLAIALSTIAIAFIFRSFALPRSVILKAFVIQTVSFLIIKLATKSYYDKTKSIKNVALFCSQDVLEEAVEKLFGSDLNLKERLIFVSSLNDLSKDKLDDIDKIYIYDIYNSQLLEKNIRRCILRGVQICIVPKSYELAMTKSDFYLMSDIPMLKIEQVGDSVEYRFVKRISDILLSSFGLILLSPIILAVALLIRATDGKHVLFKQKRVTINNKIFTVYKFRTMVLNAEETTGAVWCDKDDPRITKTGKFLRKYWLDELPQLFNILKGDMTFVGPRPERPELIEEFVKDYPDFKLRTLVKAGLTGYAQVMAKYETTPPYKLKLDLFYILNANLLLDLNIIILTIRKIFIRLLGQETPSLHYQELLKYWNVTEIKEDDSIIYYNYK